MSASLDATVREMLALANPPRSVTDEERIDALVIILSKSLANLKTLSDGMAQLTEHAIAQEKRLNDMELRLTTLAVDMPPTSRLLPPEKTA